jgi:glucose-6-phosphate isomerase
MFNPFSPGGRYSWWVAVGIAAMLIALTVSGLTLLAAGR